MLDRRLWLWQRHQHTAFRVDPDVAIRFPNRHFVAKDSIVFLGRQQCSELVRYVELDCQLEAETIPRPSLDKILEVARAVLDRCLEPVRHQIAEEGDSVE